jgi:hypothetical protein
MKKRPCRVPCAVLFAAGFVLAGPAKAQYSPAYDACVRAAGNDSANLIVCAQTELNRQDARDAKCKTDSACLLKETHDRADFLAGLVAAPTPGEVATAAAAQVSAAPAGGIPVQLIGRWTVVKTLPTKTISCWGEAEAKSVIGTEIVYTAESFQWKDAVTRSPKVTQTVLSARNFELNNSGGGANDSNVSFKQLGIATPRATQITIEHADANVTGGTTEIPGDVVILRDSNHLVFSVCNLYFLAERKP